MPAFAPASRRIHPRHLATTTAVAACLLLAGCSAGKPQAPATPAAPGGAFVQSGFLSDYSQLKPSEQQPQVFFYRDEAHVQGFQRLSIRPVAVWRGVDAGAGDIHEDDLQFIANALHEALVKKLSASFALVDEPGPGVLEIEAGFTLVPTPEADIHGFTTQVPVPELAPRKGPLPATTKRFLQECHLEVEFREVVGPAPAGNAGRRARARRAVRAAFLDTRRGADSPRGSVDTWEELAALFDHWAASLDERLTSLRDHTFKPRLTARPGAAPAR